MYPSKKLQLRLSIMTIQKVIYKSVDSSLKHLGSYLDCFCLHRPSPLMDVSIIANTINSLIKSGKIKSFGVSNFTTSQMEMFKVS